MSNTKHIYEEATYELQDGTQVTIKPLVIKQLRKFMEASKPLQDEDLSQEKMVEVLFDLTAIAIEKADPSLAKDRERLEDVLDVPTIHQIIFTASGVDFSPKDLNVPTT